MIDAQLLNILACPVTKAPVYLSLDHTELVCLASRLAYPIRDDIPVMLEQEARQIGEAEYKQLKEKYRS